MFLNDNYNPDVLSCIANLSSDEVFTPPELANKLLDMLPAAIWRDRGARFLDPGCKSGVFLREMAKRLDAGLISQIPNRQDRLNHIFMNQLYGLPITEMTSLLARRTVYCSKDATGPYSVCQGFNDSQGNIPFTRIDHTWSKGRCSQCGVSQEAYDRDKSLETHAYSFIHAGAAEEILHMRFDVIIGNPPYQMGSDGERAICPFTTSLLSGPKRLNPRYLAMIIPSRWMAGGLGLSDFRSEMLADRHIRRLVDYPVAGEVFPGVEIKGGVCYFLWERDTAGDCAVTTIRGAEVIGPTDRSLNEFDVLVRDSRALSILRKVLAKEEPSINTILSVDKEFGWTSNFDGFSETNRSGYLPLYYIRKMKRGVGYISRRVVVKSAHLIDTWKVLVPQAFNGGDSIPHQILGKSLIAPSPSVCTQSFLFFHVRSQRAAKSIQSYYKTRLFRFLVSLRKITQHATHSTYKWVPMQSWDQTWTDEDLYKKYGISKSEVALINAAVRSMDEKDE